VTKKTDNHNLSAKLAIRRWLLNRYHIGRPPDVLDCCQGSGVIWTALRREYEVESYLGLDVKRKAGRLACDSARYLEAAGWSHDLIDVDTYGSPWRHWYAVLRNGGGEISLALTIGQRVTGTVGSLS
jgi:hypothetical protein